VPSLWRTSTAAGRVLSPSGNGMSHAASAMQHNNPTT
jgi:hypothetical protein